MIKFMIDTIKNVIIPAVKDEAKKACEDWVDYTLYSKPVDLSKPGCAVDGNSGKRIRVIGPIVTIY